MKVSELLKKHPSFVYASEMQDITHPLRKIGITCFGHVHADKNGNMTGNHSDPGFLAEYLKAGLHHYDLHFGDNALAQRYFLWDAVPLIGKTFELYQLTSEFKFSHTFSIIEHGQETVDLYHFSTTSGRPYMNDFYLQHIDLLEKFIIYFKECMLLNNTLVKAYKMPLKTAPKQGGFQIDLPESFLTQEININDFLSEIGAKQKYSQKNITAQQLSRREYQCAYYLLDGHTSKEIADKLHISSRTVEIYFDRLRARFNSKNKIHLVKHLMENVFVT